jgi:hypothetical protein
LALISPLTGNLDAGGFRVITLNAGSVASPSLQPTGDTNTGIYFSAADTVDISSGGVRTASFGTSISLYAGGVQAASFVTAASGVNYLTFTPSAAAANVSIDATGSDTDIGISYDTKGAGAHIWRSAGGSTERMRLTASTLLLHTTVTTSSGAGEIVVPNGGGIRGVNALSTDTLSMINLNSSNRLVLGSSSAIPVIPVIATGSLPAAETAMNGAIIIEDGGSGDCNLIIYAQGERYRINGGANV